MKNSVNVCTCLTLGGYVAGVTIGGVLPLVLLGSGLLISISEMNKIIRKLILILIMFALSDLPLL